MIHTTMDHNVKINPQLSKKDFFTTLTMLGKRSVQLLLFLIQSTNSCLDVDCQQFQSPMVDFYLPCGLNEGVCLPWSNGLFTNKQVQTELETRDLDFTSRSCLEIGNTSASCGKITTFNLSVWSTCCRAIIGDAVMVSISNDGHWKCNTLPWSGTNNFSTVGRD